MNFFAKWLRDFRNEPQLEALQASLSLLKQSYDATLAQLTQANAVLYNTKKDALDQATKIVDLETRLSNTQEEIVALNGTIENLKTQLAAQAFEPAALQPAWLDDTKKAYTPYMKVEGDDVYLVPNEIYDMVAPIKKLLADKGWRSLPKKDKLAAIWDYTARALTYSADQVDNWQPAVVTIRRGKGDCEDGTILFVTTCWLAGIPASQVFNVCGPTDFGYHSYPIVYLYPSDGVDVEGWYIYESTLDSVPSKPLALKGSKYHVDSVANWRFFGQPKPDQLAQFNTGPGALTAEEERVIGRSEEKRRKINEYWKQVSMNGL